MKTQTILRLAVVSICLLLLNTVRAAVPPSANLELWLKAGAGMSTNADGTVTAWADQSGVASPHNGTAIGSPKLGTYEFVNGPQSVVSFSGTSDAFSLTNATGLSLTNLTIYMVVSESSSSSMRAFLSVFDRNENGYVLGISDSVNDQIKWFTLPPGNSLESVGYALTPGVPSMVSASYKGDGQIKSLFFGTDLVASKNVVPPKYSASQTAVLGALFTTGGQSLAGSIAEVLIYSDVSDAQNTQVWDYLNEKYFGLGSGPMVITHQPANQTVVEGEPVVFDVGFNGAPPASVQWYENLNGTGTFQPIPGATNVAYTNAIVLMTDQGSLFQARISNSLPSGVVSTSAILTVQPETIPLTLVAAKRDYLNPAQVTVTFNKAVTPGTAFVAGNYTIDNGLNVLQAANWVNPSNVILTLSGNVAAQTSPVLTVNNVADRANNPIAANSHATVITPLSSVLPPTSGGTLMLWLAGDNGAIADTNTSTVTNWTDLSGASADHSGSIVFGNPKLAVGNFNTGPNAVVRFDGGSGLVLNNGSDLNLSQLSIFVVASVDTTALSQEFIANWTGFAFGMSDETRGRIKFVTSDIFGAVNSLEPLGADLGYRVPTQLTGTFDSGTKSFYYNGSLVSSVSNLGLSYFFSSPTVGMLTTGGGQGFVGDIAEILVYSDVDATERASVENYLYYKYLVGAPTLVSAMWDPLERYVITLRFSQLVTPETATTLGNYSLNNGNSITNITVGVDAGTVKLMTALPLSKTVTNILTVNNIQDARSTSVIAPNSQVTLTSSGIIPRISLKRVSGDTTLNWPGPGILQSATNMTGPWSDIVGGTNGFLLVPVNGQEFFRLRAH